MERESESKQASRGSLEPGEGCPSSQGKTMAGKQRTRGGQSALDNGIWAGEETDKWDPTGPKQDRRSEREEKAHRGVCSGNIKIRKAVKAPLVKEEPEDGLPQSQELLKTKLSPHSGANNLQLAELPMPWDDIKAFLAHFEGPDEAGRWVSRVAPGLGEAEGALNDLHLRESFGKMKAAILRGEASCREWQRQRFRHFSYEEAEGPREVCGQLREFCYQWLKPEKCTKEQILELVILEQFLTILPQEVQRWVREGGPETCIQAVTLAEAFFLRQLREDKRQDEQVRIPKR